MAGERTVFKWLWVLFFLLPSLLGLLTFIVGPVCFSLGLTLFEWNLLSSPKFVGLANFGDENGWPDSHMFRLENGKMRYVHTLTVCPDGCDFPLPQE